MVGAVLVLCGVVFLLLKSDPTDTKVDSEDPKARASKAYVTVKLTADARIKEGKLADALREYKKFPREFLDTPEGKQIEKEQMDLVKQIQERFKKDREALTKLIINDPNGENFDAALALIDQMEPYCYDVLLRDIMMEKQRIVDFQDRQARDLYLKVQSEFRGRMDKRLFFEALNWMHDFLDHAPLPPGIKRSWLQFRGVDYAQIKDAVQKGEFAKLAILIEPHLALLGKVQDMDTSRMILFDLLCSAYGCQAQSDAQTGMRYFMEDKTPLTTPNIPGAVTIQTIDGKYYFVGQTGNRKQIPPVSTMDPDELKPFMERSLDRRLEKAVGAWEKDSAFMMKLGVLYMFSPSPRDYLRAAHCFRTAATLKLPTARVFLDVISQIKQNPPK
jgi:hypothetical protein